MYSNMKTRFMLSNIDIVLKDNDDLDLSFDYHFKLDKSRYANFRDYSNNLASQLSNHWGKDLLLAFSGGADSEFILSRFRQNNIPITPVIYLSPLTQIEAQYAINYCEYFNIKSIIITKTLKEHIEMVIDYMYLRIKGNGINGFIPAYIHDQFASPVLDGTGMPIQTKFSSINFDYAKKDVTHKLNEVFTEDMPNSKIVVGEWAFYNQTESRREKNPGSFFLYDGHVFYTLLKEFDYSLSVPLAKAKLYGTHFRPKIKHTDYLPMLETQVKYYKRNSTCNLGNKDQLMVFIERLNP